MSKNKAKKKKFLLLILFILTFLVGCSNNTYDNDEQTQIQGRVSLEDEQSISYQSSSPQKNKQLNTHFNEDTALIETAFYDPKEYIIKLKESVEINYIKNTLLNGQAQLVSKISENMFKLILKSDNNNGLINTLEKNPKVDYIEPNYLVQIQTIPNDPFFSKQWNLKMLGLEKTWSSFRGSQDVTVAVIDTGILTEHPDLKGNILAGYDFLDNDFDPTDTDPDFSHGTHVAGIIAAMTDNEEGISGINWDISIMPIRVIGPGGTGAYSALIAGIHWAVDNGADIINLSLAGSVDSQSLRDAVIYAVDNKVTVVAAAGNNGNSPILYPARYPEVISVAAIGPDKTRAYYSNYGPELDIVAPGGDSSQYTYHYNTILSTAGYMIDNHPIHEYSWSQGTSMATPHVSGLIALLYSTGITDPIEIRNLIKDTADDLGQAGFDEEYGAGLININRALGIDNNNNDSDNENKDYSFIDMITIIAINNTSGEEKIITVNRPNEDFFISLSNGLWTIHGKMDNYSGKVNIDVPAENKFIIQLH